MTAADHRSQIRLKAPVTFDCRTWYPRRGVLHMEKPKYAAIDLLTARFHPP